MVISDLCYYLTHDSDDGWHLLVIKYFFNEGVYPVFFFRCDVNIAFIYTGKSKILCDLLYWDICFILVVWIKPQSLQGVPVSWKLDSLAHYRGEKKVHSKLQWQAEGGWRCVCAFAPPHKRQNCCQFCSLVYPAYEGALLRGEVAAVGCHRASH